MTHLFHRQTSADMPVAVSGHGPYIVDAAGKHYLDACGGAAVSCLGHDHAAVKEAIKQQLDHIAWAHSGFFSSPPAEELGRLLANLAPGDINHVYLLSGGSEAVEAALKLARQFHLERGATEKSEIIARRQSYHGNTLGALAAGGNIPRKQPFLPLMSANMHHIGPCYYWRWAEAGESEFDYGQRMANELADKIQELGPENVAAFIAEPVVGATLGAVPAVDGYFARIREICDQNDVLLILDEVMCGMGRTGYLFASEYDRITPDIVCIAKGLGAGYQPIGAMLCHQRIYAAIEQGSGFFQHGHTYLAHAAAAAGALAVMTEISSPAMLAQVHDTGQSLFNRLQESFGQHPFIGDIRGRGLFWGLEFVADRETKAAFDPNHKLAKKLKQIAFDRGLMIYPMSGTVDGIEGDHVLLAPPYIFDDSHLDELIDKLQLTIDDAVAQL